MSFKRNTAVVYDLLGEGEITLANGLASIYLNKTPIANAAAQNQIINRVFDGSVSGTDVNFSYGGIYTAGNVRPIRVQKGYRAGTVTTTAGDADVVASTDFFEVGMIASATPAGGGLYQFVRIPGAGINGGEHVCEIVAVANGEEATLEPPPYTSVVGAPIYFDHFSYGIIDASGVVLSDSCPRSGNFKVDVGAASLELGNVNPTGLNYKFIRASFRTGTLHQAPVSNIAGFSNASFGRVVNTELKQHSDYYNKKLLWGNNTAHSFSEAGGDVEITSNTDLPVTADRILLTVTANSMQCVKPTSGDKGGVGVTLQIWFDYKTGDGAWAEQLIFGPTNNQINSAKAYVWNGTQNPFGSSTGDIVADDPEAGNYEFSFNIDQYKPFTQFRIRVKRITPVNYTMGSFTYSNSTTVRSVQGFIDDKLSYPYSAYAAIMFDSNEFEGNYPERAYHCYGIPCWVPSNYITRLESDTGIAKYTRNSDGEDTGSYVPWDGTFRKIYCDNPVWVMRTLLLENRFGLGNWIAADNINSYSLYSMARRCDELVPDGNGDLEPRFVCGVYLTKATEAYKVIKDFCSIMLSVPFWMDGQLVLEGDRPQEPIYTFTKGNIVGSLFSYESTGNKTRPNQIAVTYNNRDNFYLQDVELVDDIDDMIHKSRVYQEEAVAFGATSRSQAIRYAKWKLLTSKLNKEIVSFKTGENAGYIRPGNVVRIQDADRYRIRNSGRIVSATIDSITIDKPITLGSGVYTLHVMIPGPATYLSQDSATIDSTDYSRGDILPIYTEAEAEELVDDDGDQVQVTWSPDMHLENRVVSTSAGSNISVLEVSADFSEIPETEFIWALTNTLNNDTVEGSSKLYRVLGISEEATGLYNITASEHFNEKFDTLDETYLTEVPDTVPFNDPIPQITGFIGSVSYRNTGIEQDNTAGTRIAMDIQLRWNPPQSESVDSTTSLYANLSKYLIQYRDTYGELKSINVSKTATSYRIENVLPGSYEFSIQAFGITGASTTPIYLPILARNESDVPGAVNQRGLPRGGHFSVPPILDGKTIKAAEDFVFTSASGTTVEIVDGEPV